MERASFFIQSVVSGLPFHQPFVYKEYHLIGDSLILWASGDPTVSSSSCLVTFSAGDFKQNMTLNSSPIQATPVQIPSSCNQCDISFTLQSCTDNSSLYFAGLTFTSKDQPAAVCDQDIDYSLASDWKPGSNSQLPSQVSCSPGKSASISPHSTNVNGASVNFNFKGSGVVIYGTIGPTTYDVVGSLYFISMAPC
jgi:hypothetical protein